MRFVPFPPVELKLTSELDECRTPHRGRHWWSVRSSPLLPLLPDLFLARLLTILCPSPH